MYIHIYIYIYIERERERETVGYVDSERWVDTLLFLMKGRFLRSFLLQGPRNLLLLGFPGTRTRARCDEANSNPSRGVSCPGVQQGVFGCLGCLGLFVLLDFWGF